MDRCPKIRVGGEVMTCTRVDDVHKVCEEEFRESVECGIAPYIAVASFGGICSECFEAIQRQGQED